MKNFLEEIAECLNKVEYSLPKEGNVYVAKEIVFGKKNYPAYNNVVIVGGGGGSGKGFQISKLFGLDAKRIDVDKLKDFAITNKKIQEKIKEVCKVDISNWKLNNSEQVEMLHGYLKDINLNQKYIDYVMYSARMAADDRKPNLIFDKTLSSYAEFENLANRLISVGYKAENIHLVWVLNDYKVAIIQNNQRKRKIPDRILLTTHQGTADTMRNIINFGNSIRNFLDGDFWISFNKAQVDVKIEVSDFGGMYIKDATYFKIKESGGFMMPYSKIDEKIKEKIREYIPESVRDRWK